MIALAPILALAKGALGIALGRVTGSKTTLIATVCLAASVGYVGWLKLVHDPRVAARERAKIERKTNEAVQKSVSAQRSVPVAGAALRLRGRYCADC